MVVSPHAGRGKAKVRAIPEPDNFPRGSTIHGGSIHGIHVIAIATLSGDDSISPQTQGKVRIENCCGQQRSTEIECLPNSKIQAKEIC
ncbi:MAG: hypothetical protein PHW13_05435 [Methylococcales bacterium]|nr:hypothetical protein [Methylococcales bacterium]